MIFFPDLNPMEVYAHTLQLIFPQYDSRTPRGLPPTEFKRTVLPCSAVSSNLFNSIIVSNILSSNISQYSYDIYPTIGSSDHNLITVNCSWMRPPPLPPSSRYVCHFARVQWNNLRDYFHEFPWSTSCFSTGGVSMIC